MAGADVQETRTTWDSDSEVETSSGTIRVHIPDGGGAGPVDQRPDPRCRPSSRAAHHTPLPDRGVWVGAGTANRVQGLVVDFGPRTAVHDQGRDAREFSCARPAVDLGLPPRITPTAPRNTRPRPWSLTDRWKRPDAAGGGRGGSFRRPACRSGQTTETDRRTYCRCARRHQRAHRSSPRSVLLYGADPRNGTSDIMQPAPF